MKRLWLYLLLLGCITSAFGQDADSLKTLYIDSVWVRSTARPAPASMGRVPEEVMQYNSTTGLATVVSRNSGIYVKSYGASNLATVSLRGLTASQTKVYWNGVSINSAMNGTIDLQTLPVGLLDEVQMLQAEESANIAAGSFGGALAASSLAPAGGIKTQASVEAGSFGTYNALVKAAGGRGKWKQKGGLVYRRAENNFKFKNITLADEPVQRQANSALMQAGGMHELYHSSGFSFKNLTTYTDREIPPTMLTPNFREEQQDWLSLHQLGYTRKVKTHELDARLSYRYDKIHYTNQFIPLNAPSTTHGLVASFESRAKLKHGFSYTARLDNSSYRAVSGGFSGVQYQHVTGLFGIASYTRKWFTATYTMRQDLVDGQLAPYLPSLELGFRVKKLWRVSVLAQRNYRYPTLNDLYWDPGGNPNLQPEKGLNAELRNEFNWINHSYLSLSSKHTAYYMLIDNWILWQPGGLGYWTPVNVKEVAAQGLENEVSLNIKKQVETQLVLNYHFNKATTRKTTTAGDASLGKLLIYSPQHVLNLSVNLKYKGWYLYYNQNYTGLRYATSDNSQALDPYTLADVRVGKQLKINASHVLDLYVHCGNIWNTQYQNLAWRPMPGHSFTGGITYQFMKS